MTWNTVHLIFIAMMMVKRVLLYEEDIKRLEAIREYIESNLDRDMNIDYFVRTFGIGDSTLRKHFRQHYQTPLFHFIHDLRMNKAMELILNRRLSIQQISQAVGYKSRTAFTAAFSRYFHSSPAAYSRKNLSEQQ